MKEMYSPQIEQEQVDWEKIKRSVCRDQDSIIAKRKKEVLDNLNPNKFLSSLSKDAKSVIGEFSKFRGFVFEKLALEEINDDEENSVIANFLLKCLKKPRLLGLDSLSLKNPDHVGVVIDSQKKVAYIKGICEVKISPQGVLKERSQKQLENFYENLQEITGLINEQLKLLKGKYNLDLIPENGLEMLDFNDMDKMVIISRQNEDSDDLTQAKKSLDGKNWSLRQSIFTDKDVRKVTNHLMSLYWSKNKDQLR